MDPNQKLHAALMSNDVTMVVEAMAEGGRIPANDEHSILWTHFGGMHPEQAAAIRCWIEAGGLTRTLNNSETLHDGTIRSCNVDFARALPGYGFGLPNKRANNGILIGALKSERPAEMLKEALALGIRPDMETGRRPTGPLGALGTLETIAVMTPHWTLSQHDICDILAGACVAQNHVTWDHYEPLYKGSINILSAFKPTFDEMRMNYDGDSQPDPLWLGRLVDTYIGKRSERNDHFQLSESADREHRQWTQSMQMWQAFAENKPGLGRAWLMSGAREPHVVDDGKGASKNPLTRLTEVAPPEAVAAYLAAVPDIDLMQLRRTRSAVANRIEKSRMRGGTVNRTLAILDAVIAKVVLSQSAPAGDTRQSSLFDAPTPSVMPASLRL